MGISVAANERVQGPAQAAVPGTQSGPTARYNLQASPELQQVRQLEAQNDQLVRENPSYP